MTPDQNLLQITSHDKDFVAIDTSWEVCTVFVHGGYGLPVIVLWIIHFACGKAETVVASNSINKTVWNHSESLALNMHSYEHIIFLRIAAEYQLKQVSRK